MAVRARELTVIGEFKPFGLIAEALDGKAPDNVPGKYDYILFDPEITRDRNEVNENDTSAFALSHRSDHELFIRGNKIIWSTGARVFKRFTLPSSVIMVCWCRLGVLCEALLCILHVDSLTIYNISGEVVSVPLPCTITTIWSLPFGLLLQSATEGNSSIQNPFSSSSPLLGAHTVSRGRREIVHSPQQCSGVLGAIDHVNKGDTVVMSSHLILKDLLEEPHLMYVEERGKLTIIKEFDERTIWTSDRIPLMATYNKGKMKHSLWVAEIFNSNSAAENATLSGLVPHGVLDNQFSFRRIWQGKGAQTAASEVFMATDDDAGSVICFLLQEQKKLLSVRLQSLEIDDEIIFDIKPDMVWSLAAIAAAPVSVTRPRVKVGLLPYTDIVALAPDNTLLLFSGKQLLCKYLLPSFFSKIHLLHNLEFSETASISLDTKILGLADAVQGRINLILNSGQMLRCILRRSYSSSLVDDCITAMAEGLSFDFYNHFLLLLWGDGNSDYLSRADSSVDSEWYSFCSTILQMCSKSSTISQKHLKSEQHSSWEFLVDSKFHKNYRKLNFINGVFSQEQLFDADKMDSFGLDTKGNPCSGKSFYFELLLQSLDCLHALYESLKLDKLRKRELELLAVLLCNIAKFLGEESCLDHYIRDFPCLFLKIGVFGMPFSQRTPPSLFRWLQNCLQHGCSSANINDLPPLINKDGNSVVSFARKIVSFYSLLCGGKQIGKKLSSGVYCNIAKGSYCTSEELMVLAMVGERFGLQQLDSLPSGVSLPLRHTLDKCRESPPTDWPAAAYVLVGREDLSLSRSAQSCKYKELEAVPDVNLISMSMPYMLHLHPITIPSTVSDATGLESSKFVESDSADGSMMDGMEHIFNSSTQLRYGRDLRLNEVRRLLCSARPVAIQTSVNPSASDQDIQQAQLWQLAQRTTALPLGRGAFTLATISTLLTEAFTVPKLVLAGRLPTQQNATVNLDPNTRNIQELKSWSEFHNAVAAGLRLAPLQRKVSRTWIIYNKPEEPNVTHAGLLLALGLHGYLHVLIISDIYMYFTQEHESTTVGLMLGLATSYRKTMHPAISKVEPYANLIFYYGLRFAGTRDGNAQELLYEYAVYFLNEIKHVSATSGNALPKGLSRYVDRGTLETYLHLIVLSLSVVMAGSGHLQTFKLLRFLRSSNSADCHANYGIQMAVSLAIGFLFLGGGMWTLSTSNGSIAALLITLYPRLPTGPNDNRCHLQAFRHLYVLATEARLLQTIDVDSGLPVYALVEVTVRETENYSETSFCEVTPCILPERAILKNVRVCGPRYWPQLIELVPEDKPWWNLGDTNDPFNSGVIYIKRKVGACSYVDDPIGCQSLLSRAMHKVFGLSNINVSDPNGPGSITVDQLVSTFSSDPSLIAFAQLCCDPSWNCKYDVEFQEFCLQVLFECVSKGRPALLQVYLSLYTTIGSMADQVKNDTFIFGDSLAISSLKLALTL